jgi:hypothetical protein
MAVVTAIVLGFVVALSLVGHFVRKERRDAHFA